jgi:hypothetical protein
MIEQTIAHLLSLIAKLLEEVLKSAVAIGIVRWILVVLSWFLVAILTYAIGSIHFWWLQCKSNGTSWKAVYDEQNNRIGKLILRIRWLERSRATLIHIVHVKATETAKAKTGERNGDPGPLFTQ